MPSYVVWSSGGIVYTLIGDLPPDMLGQVVRAFPHDVPIKLTAVQRVGPGWRKSPRGSLRWVRFREAGIIESGSPYRDPGSGRRPMTTTTT